MFKFALESTDILMEPTGDYSDQMAQDVRQSAELEFGSMDQLVFDQKTSIMPELKKIPDDAMLGFNVFENMDAYMQTMANKDLDGSLGMTVE